MFRYFIGLHRRKVRKIYRGLNKRDQSPTYKNKHDTTLYYGHGTIIKSYGVILVVIKQIIYLVVI